MSQKAYFEGFSEEEQEKYALEAEQLYDPETVRASNKKWKGYSEAKRAAIMAEGRQVYQDMIAAMPKGASSIEVQAIVERWRKHAEQALKAARIFNPSKIIVVFGSAGGGRDKWRRPVMGEVADKYADLIIVTTDDPYDEDPSVIIENILSGILKNPRRNLNENVFNITDRREAIKKALSLAKENDLILIAGKGGEVWMNVAKGKKIPWDDRQVIKETIKNLDKI